MGLASGVLASRWVGPGLGLALSVPGLVMGTAEGRGVVTRTPRCRRAPRWVGWAHSSSESQSPGSWPPCPCGGHMAMDASCLGPRVEAGSPWVCLLWWDSSPPMPGLGPGTAGWGRGYSRAWAALLRAGNRCLTGQGTAPSFRKLLTGLFGVLARGAPGVSGRSASVLSPCPRKRFIEDFSEARSGVCPSPCSVKRVMARTLLPGPRGCPHVPLALLFERGHLDTGEGRWSIRVRQVNRFH